MPRKLWLALIVVGLMALLIPACGGGGEEEITPTATGATLTPTATTISTNTPVTTPTPAIAGDVKIGAITAWSGPAAISGITLADPVVKLIEKQVKDQGGILGGRELDVVKYDCRSSPAESVAGATKLHKEEKVSAIVWGGAGSADVEATIGYCEENRILIVPFATPFGYDGEVALNPTPDVDGYRVAVVDLLNKVLKPKTIGILAADDARDSRRRVNFAKPDIEAAGIKIVYEQYCPLDTSDYMPYLTKIKYEKPDVLYLDFTANEPFLTIAKQIIELGGLGNTQMITMPGGVTAVKQTGAQGWYVMALWLPDSQYPASQKYVQEYQALNGSIPTGNHIYYYNSLWTAIHAIELAGTDSDLEKIIQAARSGNLEWDTPTGFAHFTPDGQSGLQLAMGHIENKQMVSFIIPD